MWMFSKENFTDFAPEHDFEMLFTPWHPQHLTDMELVKLQL